MVNNLVLIGRITQDINIVTLDSGKKVTEITVAVTRNFKNFEGSYDTDFIKVTLWDAIATSAQAYCVKGSLVSIIGRLQIKQSHIDERKINMIEVIAEHIGFLSKKA